MGLFWDLIQQSQIGAQKAQTTSLEARILSLERELHETQRLLQALLMRLESNFGKDFDGDGRVG